MCKYMIIQKLPLSIVLETKNKKLIKLYIGSTKVDNKFSVDFGDGNIIEYVTDIIRNDIYYTEVSGIGNGTIKIYGDYLTHIECSHNKLINLDVSNNKKIIYLSCSHSKLQKIDLSNNKQLLELFCTDNKLSSININNCKKLTRLFCYNNKLIILDVSSNIKLKHLHYGKNNGITIIT